MKKKALRWIGGVVALFLAAWSGAALGQAYPTLSEAMAVMSRVSGWHLAEAAQLDNDLRYYVEFSYRLDASQLPQPLQIGLGNEWSLGISRVLKVDERLVEAVAR